MRSSAAPVTPTKVLPVGGLDGGESLAGERFAHDDGVGFRVLDRAALRPGGQRGHDLKVADGDEVTGESFWIGGGRSSRPAAVERDAAGAALVLCAARGGLLTTTRVAATATTAAAAASGMSQPAGAQPAAGGAGLWRGGRPAGFAGRAWQVADLLADRATGRAELVFYGHESPLSMRVIAAIPRGGGRLDGAFRDAHDPRDLVDGHVQAVAERHRLALPVGEAAQCGENLAVLLAEQQPRVGGLGVRRLDQRELGVPRAFAQHRTAAVEHARADVGEGALGVVERVPAAEQAEEGVLHRVLGRLPLTEHDHREAEQPKRVRLVQRRHLLRGICGRIRRHRHVREWVHIPETRRRRPGCSLRVSS